VNGVSPPHPAPLPRLAREEAPRSPAGSAAPGERRIGSAAIRRGIVLGGIGAAAPALAGVALVPGILAGLGRERFGVLSLAWVFINSVGILDLGIGRALTRYLAVREEADATREAATVWTSLAVILGLGAACGAAVWAASGVLAGSLAHGDAAVRVETAATLRVLALSVPAVMVSSGLRGVLEAFGRFDLTNRVSIPITLANVVVPALLLRAGASLLTVVAALVALRLLGTLLLLGSVLELVPEMRRPRLRAAGMSGVLAFGGWVTVSYLPAPLFAQAERWLLGSLAALSAVAYYATPVDVLGRVTVIPGAVLQVLFPVLAQTLRGDRDGAARVANRALVLVAAAVLPLVTLLAAVAPEALAAWLGPDFAAHGARAARIVALVTYLNCLDWLAFSVVQGAGHASWTGKLRAVEFPVYLALTAALVRAGGVNGAALAALLRAVVDGGALVLMASRVLGPAGRAGRNTALLAVAGALAIAGASAPVALALRLAASTAALAATGALAWRLVDPAAREAIRAWGRSRRWAFGHRRSRPPEPPLAPGQAHPPAPALEREPGGTVP
jgi:O-antigen/teichoic acid export membrane protein